MVMISECFWKKSIHYLEPMTFVDYSFGTVSCCFHYVIVSGCCCCCCHHCSHCFLSFSSRLHVLFPALLLCLLFLLIKQRKGHHFCCLTSNPYQAVNQHITRSGPMKTWTSWVIMSQWGVSGSINLTQITRISTVEPSRFPKIWGRVQNRSEFWCFSLFCSDTGTGD